jgi:RND family efflux transporter MFP subunit
MRFLGRSLTGVFLLATTFGLLALAGLMIKDAMQASADRDNAAPTARERIFSANLTTIQAQKITPVLTAYGELSSRRELDVRPLTGGAVAEISPNFETGAIVQEGDLLLRIDPTNFQRDLELTTTDLSQAEAEQRDARSALDLAQDDLKNAQRQSDLRSAALERQKNLVSRKVGTEAAVEAAAFAASSAQQSVLAKRQSVITAQARLSTAQAGVTRQKIQLKEAQRRLDETNIYAKISGVLSDVSVLRGGVVTANERLGRIVDPATLEAQFRLSTAQYSRLLTDQGLNGTSVVARLDATGVNTTTFGKIERESGDVGEGQTGRLIFATLAPNPAMRPGDFVTIEVDEPTLDTVFQLPASALDANQEVLVLGADDRLEAAPVVLLRRQGNDVIIRADTLEGREVVTQRTQSLGAGIRIRPVRDGVAAPEKIAEMIPLDPERIARLKAFVGQNKRMPEAARERILKQLEEGQLPADTLARLEKRMGH